MTFTKYEFANETEWATYQAQIQQTNIGPDGTESKSYVGCAVVELGNICFATDEEGNCTDLSPLYAVDILWNGEPLESFSTKEVFPDPCGIHVFSGCEDMYLKRFCQFNHDSPFCNLET
jgi:hypothetical protein